MATPELTDPNFSRTVSLMLEHTEEGALGVVLNRPRLVPAEAAVPHWGPVVAEPGVLHQGGPVADDSIIGLGRIVAGSPLPPTGVTPIVGNVGAVDLSMSPGVLPLVESVRLFSGYAGWQGGQLDAEIEIGSWFVLDAEDDDVFTTDADELWSRVFSRQKGLLSRFSEYPDEPSLN